MTSQLQHPPQREGEEITKEFTEEQLALRYGICLFFGILIGAVITTLVVVIT